MVTTTTRRRSSSSLSASPVATPPPVCLQDEPYRSQTSIHWNAGRPRLDTTNACSAAAACDGNENGPPLPSSSPSYQILSFSYSSSSSSTSTSAADGERRHFKLLQTMSGRRRDAPVGRKLQRARSRLGWRRQSSAPLLTPEPVGAAAAGGGGGRRLPSPPPLQRETTARRVPDLPLNKSSSDPAGQDKEKGAGSGMSARMRRRRWRVAVQEEKEAAWRSAGHVKEAAARLVQEKR